MAEKQPKETPQYRITGTTARAWFWPAYQWLGDPEARYGILKSSRQVDIYQMLEMLLDPILAMADAFVTSALMNARYVIRCQDEAKMEFFRAVYEPWHRPFMLMSSRAVPLGYCGLVKKLRFQKPVRLPDQEIEPWTSAADPIICVGFRQIHPTVGKPKFNEKTGKFEGIEVMSGDTIPIEHALWITRGLELAYGYYYGRGRLPAVYRTWWDRQFSLDLRIRHIETYVSPGLKVHHPSGQVMAEDDPTTVEKTYAQIAMETGHAFRAGAVVTLPSEPYESINVDGSKSPTGIRKWDMDIMQTGENLEAFERIRNQDVAEMLIGYLIPPQAITDVRERLGGGESVARILGEVARATIALEAATLDEHLNEYVFDKLSSYNFSPDTPRAVKETTGFDMPDVDVLLELTGRYMGSPFADLSPFDLTAALEQLRMPIYTGEGPQPIPPVVAMLARTLKLDPDFAEKLPDDKRKVLVAIIDHLQTSDVPLEKLMEFEKEIGELPGTEE